MGIRPIWGIHSLTLIFSCLYIVVGFPSGTVVHLRDFCGYKAYMGDTLSYFDLLLSIYSSRFSQWDCSSP